MPGVMLLKNKNLKISLAAIDILLILFILASAYIFLDTQKQEANDGNSNLNLMIPAEVSEPNIDEKLDYSYLLLSVEEDGVFWYEIEGGVTVLNKNYVSADSVIKSLGAKKSNIGKTLIVVADSGKKDEEFLKLFRFVSRQNFNYTYVESSKLE